MINIAKWKEEAGAPEALYRELWNEYVAGRYGASELLKELEDEGFFHAPASAKHHLAEPGGLVKHSVNVALAAIELCEGSHAFQGCDICAVVTAALLHDICKVKLYEPTGDPQHPYRRSARPTLGHGEESAIIAADALDLDMCEIYAIRWHMGAYTGERDWDNVARAYERYPEAMCLHFADMIATHYDEARV